MKKLTILIITAILMSCLAICIPALALDKHVFDDTGFFNSEEIDAKQSASYMESTGSDLIILLLTPKGFSAEIAAEYYESVRDYENKAT